MFVFAGSILGLILSATQALRALPEREVASGCDAFGYLRSAQMIRRGEGFDVRTEQTHLLINELEKRQIPTQEWSHLVAPHAYRYIEKSDKVSLQYPPGTGLLMAIFPQGWGAFGVTLASILLVILGASFLFDRAYRKRDPVAAVAVAVLGATALVTLERIGFRSYSINALVVPLLLAVFAAAKRWPGWSGLLLGFCVLIRVPAVLLVPGIAWLACRNRRDGVWFALGLAFSGFLPLAIYNWIYAGLPWATPYGSGDTAGPTLGILAKSIPYYLGIDLGAKLNWTLVLAGLAGWKHAKTREKQAAALTFLIGLAYFLTHPILIPYYMTPSILGAVACLLMPLTLSEKALRLTRGNAAAWVGVLLIWPLQSFSPRTPQPPPLDRKVPQALLDPKAWVWSDELSGTFLYEFEKASFKPQLGSDRAIRAVFEVAARRSERQFLVQDIGIHPEFLEAIRRGAYGPYRLEATGATALGSPVFELVERNAAR